MAMIAEARLVRFYGDDKGWHVREKGGPAGGLRLSTWSLPQTQTSILDPGRVPNDFIDYVRGFKDTVWYVDHLYIRYVLLVSNDYFFCRMIHDVGPLSRSMAADGTHSHDQCHLC